ncbi:She4p LALA0_S05e02916g [Lachancea lanzarotensis]|uniref:LALA0S05e02916g1_1 n=1 Tax=Lachancea lanzarotensis TaxID=1245769 RepID=A0A0C7MX69_9SACH|nr:uncharacterized protein LALA0_S05e02916g [Lachancea lanzarotensis]CEP62319.1 LALA0S05e02916g1_1 [Lachancea lanzarotensis]
MGDVDIPNLEALQLVGSKKQDQENEKNRQFENWTGNDFINGVNQLFQENQDAADKTWNELLLKRALDDYAESRDFTITKFRENIDTGLTILSSCGLCTTDIVYRCFEGREAVDLLVLEIIKILELQNDKWVDIDHTDGSGSDNNPFNGPAGFTSFLLTLAVELVSKKNLEFEKVKSFVKIAVLRAHGQIEPIKLLYAMAEKYEQQFRAELLEVFTSLLEEGNQQKGLIEAYLLAVVSVLKALYLKTTTFCTELFTSEQFQAVAQPNLFKSSEITGSLLDLMSIACIDSVARNYIAENYFILLSECLSIEAYKFAATLVLLKTWNFTKLKGDAIDDMASTLIHQLNVPQKQNSAESLKQDELAIEGLAYLSLKLSVKTLLLSSLSLHAALVDYLRVKTTPNSMYYGILVILGNLTESQDPNASIDKSIQGLKDRAEPSNIKAHKETEPIKEATILKFISDCILSRDVVGHVRSHIKIRKMQGTGSHHQLLRLIYNAAKNKAFITTLVSQGSVTILLESLVLPSIPSEVRILALRALARILTAVDPKLIFKEYSSLNALPFLFEILPDPALSSENSSQVQDIYESLLALTNLATLSESSALCDKIVSTPAYWIKLENLMLDSVVEIQRSALELFSNMMASSLRVAVKFFNFQNPLSVRNFKILVKLLNLDDRKSRLAVAAIFANITTSVPFIAEELSQQADLMKNAIEILHDQKDDTEMRHRLLVLLDALMDSGIHSEVLSSQRSELKKALLEAQKAEPSSSQYSASISNMISKL